MWRKRKREEGIEQERGFNPRKVRKEGTKRRK